VAIAASLMAFTAAVRSSELLLAPPTSRQTVGGAAP